MLFLLLHAQVEYFYKNAFVDTATAFYNVLIGYLILAILIVVPVLLIIHQDVWYLHTVSE